MGTGCRNYFQFESKYLGLLSSQMIFYGEKNRELWGKLLKHGTRRRVRQRRQFHCKFSNFGFRKR